jgi:hypothetical protein
LAGAVLFAGGTVVLPVLHLSDHQLDHRHERGGVSYGVNEHDHGHAHDHDHDYDHDYDHDHDHAHDDDQDHEQPSDEHDGREPDPAHGRGALAHFGVGVTAAPSLPAITAGTLSTPAAVAAPQAAPLILLGHGPIQPRAPPV